MKLRKLTAVLMALVMIFALSATAFANENATVTLVINDNIAGTSSSYEVPITANDTVYSVVSSVAGNAASWMPTTPDANYSPLRDPNSALYNPNASAQILRSLYGKASVAYEPDDNCLDDDCYVHGYDFTLDYYDDLYADLGGLYMYLGYGMFTFGDSDEVVYIGTDWTFTVNDTIPGLELDDHPIYGDLFQYYMNECALNNGDAVVLTYKTDATVFAW